MERTYQADVAEGEDGDRNEVPDYRPHVREDELARRVLLEGADVQNVDGRRVDVVARPAHVHAVGPQQRRHEGEPHEEGREDEAARGGRAVAEARLQRVADGDVAGGGDQYRQPRAGADEDVLEVHAVQLVVHEQGAALEGTPEALTEGAGQHAETEEDVGHGEPGEDDEDGLLAVLQQSFMVAAPQSDEVEDVGEHAEEADHRDDEAVEDVFRGLHVRR